MGDSILPSRISATSESAADPHPSGKVSVTRPTPHSARSAVVQPLPEDLECLARGVGLTTIAKTLNAEAAPSPRAQQGRPRAGAPSTVREVLYRTLYKGEITWNRSRKRSPSGQVQRQERPQAEWFTISAPDLQIVSDQLWQQVHERLDQQRSAYLRGTNGQLWGRPARGVESKYLLSGLARCGSCGGSMYVKSRSHGKKRAFFWRPEIITKGAAEGRGTAQADGRGRSGQTRRAGEATAGRQP